MTNPKELLTEASKLDPSLEKHLSNLKLLNEYEKREAQEARVIELFGSLEVASVFFQKMKGKSDDEVLMNFNALRNGVEDQKKEKEAERLKKLRKEAIPVQIITALIIALMVYLLWD